MKRIFFLLCLITLVMGSCNRKNNRSISSTNQGTVKNKTVKGIHFKEGLSFNKVLNKAKAQNKPIFIDFYTTWCAPCKWLERDVFELDQVGDLFNPNFISIKVDAEKGEGVELASRFGVYAYPTLIYLDSNGEIVEQQVGMTSASVVMNKARTTISANNNSPSSGTW